MEKTIKSLVLLMIITGTIFTLTACNSGIGSQYPKGEEENIAGDGVGAEEVSDSDDGGDTADVEESAALPVVQEAVPVQSDDAGILREPEAAPAAQPQVDTNAGTQVQSQADTNVPVQDAAVQYTDGTYAENVTYKIPGDPQAISFTFTLKNDVLTDLVVTPEAVDGTAKRYQEIFTSGINSLVIGKKLDEIGNIGAVNGSSLTPNGFNSAIALLKNEAKK